MAEALRADRSGFAHLDDLVNYPLVRLWLYWGMFWLMFTPTFGVTISAMFNFPDYLGTSEYLTFGRLRPVHVNGVIFGAFSTLFIGLCYYLRAAPVRRARAGRGARLLAGVGLEHRRWSPAWLSLPLGYNQGLEAGEFPLAIDIGDLHRHRRHDRAVHRHDRAAARAAALCQRCGT